MKTNTLLPIGRVLEHGPDGKVAIWLGVDVVVAIDHSSLSVIQDALLAGTVEELAERWKKSESAVIQTLSEDTDSHFGVIPISMLRRNLEDFYLLPTWDTIEPIDGTAFNRATVNGVESMLSKLFCEIAQLSLEMGSLSIALESIAAELNQPLQAVWDFIEDDFSGALDRTLALLLPINAEGLD